VATQVTFDPSHPSEHVALAAKSLRDGYVIVAPHENGYVLLSDAFSPDSVRAMHVLRGDDLGVAAQVVISDLQQIDGLARDITSDARTLMEKFWPGPLSLSLRPQAGLSWDLGDDGKLDWVCLRQPAHPFLQLLIKETGPLAIASGALAGQSPLQDLAHLTHLDHEIAVIIDSGVIEIAPASTHLQCESAGITLLREGAITRSEIEKAIPAVVIS
jgi:tRNA threonylcarbamoyl adenosine modification protein (Sua5/YciO/YrdC/YwlC family)